MQFHWNLFEYKSKCKTHNWPFSPECLLFQIYSADYLLSAVSRCVNICLWFGFWQWPTYAGYFSVPPNICRNFTEYIPPWIWGFTFWGWMKYPRQKLATRCVIDWMAILWCEWTQGIGFLGMCHWILNLKYHCYFEKYCSMPWETIRNVENVTVYENQLQNLYLHESCICLFLLYRSNPRKVTTGAL